MSYHNNVSSDKMYYNHIIIKLQSAHTSVLLYLLFICYIPTEIQSWIVCDGDIDPEWIESLNSVLDDNRLLTMPSGERIQFGPNVNFLFETHDLSCASPATISRMGMIFLRCGNFHTCTLV